MRVETKIFDALSYQDTPITHLPTIQIIKRLFNAFFIKRILLSNWLDAMECCKVQHGLMNRPGRHNVALDPDPVHQQRHIWKLEISYWIYTQRKYRGPRSKNRQVQIPIRLGCAGDQKMIEWFSDLELLDTLCRIEFAGPQAHGFVLLALGTRNYNNFAAEFASELYSKMTETAYADDTHAICRADIVHLQCSEDGGPAAHEWRCML
ncbi:MAG: hypothetical protein Q9218_008007 [Villophora microphyllina]